MPPGRPRKKQGDILIKSAELIGWALGGIEREIGQTKDRLAALTAQATKLRARLGVGRGSAAAATPAAGRKRKRRKMSAESRKRISDMMRKRWAETKKSGKRRLG